MACLIMPLYSTKVSVRGVTIFHTNTLFLSMKHSQIQDAPSKVIQLNKMADLSVHHRVPNHSPSHKQRCNIHCVNSMSRYRDFNYALFLSCYPL
mmetsp:Transcript_25482/g.53262  ORF Transcript_25482/g.53262 Transcript_25482/m.53262 type:complete len:94 (+) Transcript_25482:681-962(+)